MDKLIKKSFPKQIADTIEVKIKNGEYEVGDKLPPEPKLVEMFGVSRNTVREAIQSLTHSGLLETRQGDGTYVIAKERLQVDFFNIMNATTYQNVLEVRDLLEKHIVVSAIRNRTMEDLIEIESFVHLRKEDVGTIHEATKADLDFHIAIAKATHNDIILRMYRYVSEYFNEFIYHKIYEQKQDEFRIDQLHDLLFQAIRDKNEELALDCVNKIIEI